jgi:transposase
MAGVFFFLPGCILMVNDEQPALFEPSESETAADRSPPPGTTRPAPRFNRPERLQGEMRSESLDQRLDADHPARVIWNLVEALDLTPLYERIRAVEGEAGRNATDPRVLFALWLFACTQSVGSARELDRLCREHRAYEWLRGGVPINYHLLADFRVKHQELLDQLLSETLAGLSLEGLVHLECVAQDGMRIRASAGTSSFDRQPKLEETLQQARAHVVKLRTEAEADPGASTRRQQKARERAAREKVERIEKALEHVKQVAEQREARKKGDGPAARASTTDPEARNMKMPDGGFRPAFNVQFATDTASGIITGVDVINQGTDAGQMKPMVDQIEERLGQPPAKMTTDGGFATVEDIEKTTAAGTTVFTPVKQAKQQIEAGKDPYAPRPGDSPIISDWRQRMGTEMARLIYKLRAQTAELTNARMRNQGLYQVNVRGLAKVKAVILWHVLAHNLLRAEVLRTAALRAELETAQA